MILGVVKSRCLSSNRLSLSAFKCLLTSLALFLFPCCCWLTRCWRKQYEKILDTMLSFQGHLFAFLKRQAKREKSA